MDTEADLLTPVVTPFDGDAVDENALADLLGHLERAGLDGVVPCGTTGEFASLTDEELETVLSTTVQTADDLTVIAGTSGTAVGTVRERIAIAEDLGVDGVLIVAPYFHTAPAPEGNERFFEAALADADVPVFLYNIPPAVGDSIDVGTVRSLAERDLIAGVKDSSGDLRYFSRLLRQTPDSLTVYQGYDGGFVQALTLGADGGITALAQVMPGAFGDAARAVERGNVGTARDVQRERIDPPFDVLMDCGFATAIKTLLADQGAIPSPAVRPPLVGLDDDQRNRLLTAAGADPGD